MISDTVYIGEKISLKAVIFDYGQVLCFPQSDYRKQQLQQLSGIEPGEFWQRYWDCRPAYDMHELNGVQYWHKVLAGSARTISAELVADLIAADNVSWSQLDPSMWDWLRQLQDYGLKVGLISNMGRDLMEHVIKTYACFADFDQMTFSCILKINKPDSAIYHHCLDELQVAPEAALFIDDRPANITGAQLVGCHCILYESLRSLRDIVEQQFDLPPVAVVDCNT